MTTILLNSTLPADAETRALFEKITTICATGLYLFEEAGDFGERAFAAGDCPILTERDAQFAKVHFRYRDVADDEPAGKRVQRTPEEKRETYRLKLRNAVTQLEAISPAARSAAYSTRVAQAAQVSKAASLPRLVGGTAKQRAYAELIRAEKIKKLFPAKYEQLVVKVKSSLDYITLANGCRSEVDAVLEKHGV